MVDRVKIGRAARRKGTAYERKIARLLTKITGFNWRRVPYSGASYIPGDVTIVDGDCVFPYTVELKNRKDLTLQKVFKNPDVLLQYMEENTVLIFNSGGQSLVVFPVSVKKEDVIYYLTSAKIYGTIMLRNEEFLIFDIKHFGLLVEREVKGGLEKE